MNEHLELYANNLPKTKWYGYPSSIVVGSVIFVGYHLFRTIIESIEFSKRIFKNYIKERKLRSDFFINSRIREKESKLANIDL